MYGVYKDIKQPSSASSDEYVVPALNQKQFVSLWGALYNLLECTLRVYESLRVYGVYEYMECRVYVV